MAKLKYTYAYDKSKTRLVHIKDARQGEVYYCLNDNCNERLSIKDGIDRTKHFFHVNNGDKCSYDNYLHTLAKKRIAEWFESGKNITIGLKTNTICAEYENCIWRSYDIEENFDCVKEETSYYILNNSYNKISIEKKYEGFNWTWDLLLTNTLKEKLPPTAIEIYVTHKCEEDKINSGIRIIEIKIESEQQLEDIIKSGKLVHGKYISFYNFKANPKTYNAPGIYLNKVILNNKMLASWSYVNCKFYQKRNRYSIFEMTFDRYVHAEKASFIGSYNWACAIIKKYYPDFLNCNLCVYYKYNDKHNGHICILYQKLKLFDKHDAKNAINCTSFILNKKSIFDAEKINKYISRNEWKINENIIGKNIKREIED